MSKANSANTLNGDIQDEDKAGVFLCDGCVEEGTIVEQAQSGYSMHDERPIQ